MAHLALYGGTPVRTRPFHEWPIVTDEIVDAVTQVARSGLWGHTKIATDQAEEFREQFARYYGVDYAIPTTNGSTALELALRNLGVTFGDEVITPACTWCATNLAPVIVGAEPVFVDADPSNYCIDPQKIENAITVRTKAILIVHIGGYVCDMDRIMEVAEKHDLPVIEDCAQAHGSRYKGRLVGSIGAYGTFSFERSKLMTAGEGGMVITNDAHIADPPYGNHVTGKQAELIQSKRKYYFGWNYRMTEFQVAVLLPQLKELEKQRQKRVENAEYLKRRLSEIDGVEALNQSLEQNYYSYLFRYDEAYFNSIPKKLFQKALKAEGITLFASPSDQGPAYRSEYFHSPRKDHRDIFCPETERIFVKEAVGMPATWMLLGSTSDMDDVADAIIKIREHLDEFNQYSG